MKKKPSPKAHKKPVAKAKPSSAVVTPPKPEKPAEGIPAPGPEPLAYSQRETFFWLDHAVRLERGIGENYALVRASVDMASTILISLMRQEVSIDDLDKELNEKGNLCVGKLRLDEKKIALRVARTTGNVQDRIVQYAKKRHKGDAKFLNRLGHHLGHALSMEKLPPAIDYGRISDVAKFLVDNWCGAPGQASYAMLFRLLKTDEFPSFDKAKRFFFMPPLCFFDGKALASLCECVLGKEQSATNIRKWVSRLQLEQVRTPKIREIKKGADGIYFKL